MEVEEVVRAADRSERGEAERGERWLGGWRLEVRRLRLGKGKGNGLRKYRRLRARQQTLILVHRPLPLPLILNTPETLYPLHLPQLRDFARNLQHARVHDVLVLSIDRGRRDRLDFEGIVGCVVRCWVASSWAGTGRGGWRWERADRGCLLGDGLGGAVYGFRDDAFDDSFAAG